MERKYGKNHRRHNFRLLGVGSRQLRRSNIITLLCDAESDPHLTQTLRGASGRDEVRALEQARKKFRENAIEPM